MAPQRAPAHQKDPDAPVPAPEEMPTSARMEAFSDGVFAVIITLLVLGLRVPPKETLPPGRLGAALARQWPMYVAYTLSFLQVGVVWSHHHTMFHYIRRIDHLLLIWNLLLLLFVALLPFSTELLSEYIRGAPADQRLAALTYSGTLIVAGLCFNAAWRHARAAHLVTPTADPHRLEALERHWLLIPLTYGTAFVLALVSVDVSVALYGLLLLYYALPGPTAVRWLTARQARRAAVE